MIDREEELKGDPITLDKYRACRTYGKLAEEHWDRFRAVSKGWFKWVVKTGNGEHTVGRYFDEIGALEAAADLRTAFLDGVFIGVNSASERTANDYREALIRARETNRKLQRRLQKAEGPAESYKQQLEYVKRVGNEQWSREFTRVTSAYRELREIFMLLTSVYGHDYPREGKMLHSCMNVNVENDNGKSTEHGEVYANCFNDDMRVVNGAPRIKSYRVVDEVKRLVEDFIELKAKKDDPAQELAGKLIDAACEANGGQISWEKAIGITAATTKMPDAERDRLLAYGADESKLDRLKKFYNVGTIEELIDAQSQHIEKLQERVKDKEPSTQVTTSPREG